jgi:hypothetical protein
MTDILVGLAIVVIFGLTLWPLARLLAKYLFNGD